MKCGVGEGLRSVEPIISEMKKCYIVGEERNVLHKIKLWKGKWIGHILRSNCCRKYVIEGEDGCNRKTGMKL